MRPLSQFKRDRTSVHLAKSIVNCVGICKSPSASPLCVILSEAEGSRARQRVSGRRRTPGVRRDSSLQQLSLRMTRAVACFCLVPSGVSLSVVLSYAKDLARRRAPIPNSRYGQGDAPRRQYSATAWLSQASSPAAGVRERPPESVRADAVQYKRSRRESAGGRSGEPACASAIPAKLATFEGFRQ